MRKLGYKHNLGGDASATCVQFIQFETNSKNKQLMDTNMYNYVLRSCFINDLYKSIKKNVITLPYIYVTISELCKFEIKLQIMCRHLLYNTYVLPVVKLVN